MNVGNAFSTSSLNIADADFNLTDGSATSFNFTGNIAATTGVTFAGDTSGTSGDVVFLGAFVDQTGGFATSTTGSTRDGWIPAAAV